MKIKIESLSLLDLRKKYGIGSAGFYDNNWWLNESFAKEKPEAGEYEIDLNSKLVNLTFEEQKKKLKKGFEVAHPAIIAQAILKHYEQTGKRLCDNYWVRTSSVDSDGDHVNLGYFDATGLKVIYYYWDGNRHDDLAVSSARKLKDLKTGKLETLETLPPELTINNIIYVRKD